MARSSEAYFHYPTTGKCSLCGKPASAFWVGENGTVEFCQLCAFDRLPMIIADAIPMLSHAWLDRAPGRMAERFYRAVACRAVRELERRRKQEVTGNPTHISRPIGDVLDRHGI